MKKLLLFVLALTLCLSLAACNDSQKDPYESSDATDEVTGSASDEQSGMPAETSAAPAIVFNGGKLENNVYTNDYLSFALPEGFVLTNEAGSDYLSPAEPTGDSISVLFAEKDGSFDQITKEELEKELQSVITGVAIDDYIEETIDGTKAIRFHYTAKLDELLSLSITQIVLDADATVTITLTDYSSTHTAAFADLIQSIDMK